MILERTTLSEISEEFTNDAQEQALLKGPKSQDFLLFVRNWNVLQQIYQLLCQYQAVRLNHSRNLQRTNNKNVIYVLIMILTMKMTMMMMMMMIMVVLLMKKPNVCVFVSLTNQAYANHL